MLHNGDFVEEVATKRQGRIIAVDTLIEDGKAKQQRWRVSFDDPKQPNPQYFVKEDDLRVVECPHIR